MLIRRDILPAYALHLVICLSNTALMSAFRIKRRTPMALIGLTGNLSSAQESLSLASKRQVQCDSEDWNVVRIQIQSTSSSICILSTSPVSIIISAHVFPHIAVISLKSFCSLLLDQKENNLPQHHGRARDNHRPKAHLCTQLPLVHCCGVHPRHHRT